MRARTSRPTLEQPTRPIAAARRLGPFRTSSRGTIVESIAASAIDVLCRWRSQRLPALSAERVLAAGEQVEGGQIGTGECHGPLQRPPKAPSRDGRFESDLAPVTDSTFSGSFCMACPANAPRRRAARVERAGRGEAEDPGSSGILPERFDQVAAPRSPSKGLAMPKARPSGVLIVLAAP